VPEIYKGRGLSKRKVHEILGKIRRVETDNDWDGVSAAAQLKTHFPKMEVRISGEKSVPSDERTLVLDKATSGTGWLIDHHPDSLEGTKAKVMYFSEGGQVPTSRLVYIAIGKGRLADIFLSATAEISDGLNWTGSKSGSLRLLQEKMPEYSKTSGSSNQFLTDQEIYTMTDVLSLIAEKNPKYALELGMSFYGALPRNMDQLSNILDSSSTELVGRYREFINSFSFTDFDNTKLFGRKVTLIDGTKIGEFQNSALEMTKRRRIGNYVMFRGPSVSIRTGDHQLFKSITAKLDDVSKGHGGRAGWYGITLKHEMEFEQFRQLIREG
jgi:hypothetical protein